MARGAWRLSGYKVDELIGTGGSGEVWRATVTSTGIPVALKRIWLSERAQRQAAISEAAILSELDHPHLMKLHDVRHVDDAIVLVLDLAAGGSLAALLARRGRLTVGEVITALAPIGSALAYAHNGGVVHGDVSSANILFTDIGLPLLADLGVARLLGDDAPVRTTPSYVDPTVADGAIPIPASDVFMLGAVALHALTGTAPWPGGEAEEVLEAAARTGVQPDWTGRMAAAGVPDAVSRVVARALTLDPARRGTAADFALELRHAGEPVAVELSAGRARRALVAPDSWPLESVPAGSSVPAVQSSVPVQPSVPVPPFARLPLTAGVRAPSPFAATPPARHLARGTRPRVAGGLVIAAAAVAVAVAAVVLWPGSGPHRGVVRAAPSSRSSPSSSAPGPSVRAVLTALDATRSRAFARREPQLLSNVYGAPGLLARDRALLLSIVPSGCGLRGVHTRFAAIAAVRHGSRTRVRARMSLAPSRLICDRTRIGTAPGTPDAWTEIVLVRHGPAYLIVSEHQG